MDDPEVIEAFLEAGSIAVFGPSLHVERGTLKLDGWWPLAYRVSDRTLLLRDEPAPTDSTAPADVAAALTAKGLTAVGDDLPGIGMATYTNIDLGYAPWMLWSTDRATGEADLNAKVTEESFLEGGAATATGPGPATEHEATAGARGARRLAGDATRVVLAVGVGDDWTDALRDGLADCRIERRAFGEIGPDACGSLLLTLLVVDATRPAGTGFVAQLRASEAVSAPVVAITPSGEMLAGADATISAGDPPGGGLALIRDLLQ